ncbi:hypothetical protein ABPG75_011022 [Micractinium tetrahymenae]
MSKTEVAAALQEAMQARKAVTRKTGKAAKKRPAVEPAELLRLLEDAAYREQVCGTRDFALATVASHFAMPLDAVAAAVEGARKKRKVAPRGMPKRKAKLSLNRKLKKQQWRQEQVARLQAAQQRRQEQAQEQLRLQQLMHKAKPQKGSKKKTTKKKEKARMVKA